MGTYVIMAMLLIFLAVTLLWNCIYSGNTDHFFDKENSNAMRGFWCLIVILVHIPTDYQNTIQDMLGSFAYIGVTFFFMTSAYGLSYGLERDDGLKAFWRRRLPKLLISCLLVNLISAIFSVFTKADVSFIKLVHINGWVEWLLICYFFFWSTNKISKKYSELLIIVLVALFSLIVYKYKDSISQTTWYTEVFGFVWGLLLFRYKEKIVGLFKKKWFLKCLILCCIAGVTGIAYLKYKTIFFLGDYVLKIVLGVLILAFILAVNTHIVIGNNISHFLGNISFEIYLLHGTTFALIKCLYPYISSGLFILISFGATIILAFFTNIMCRNVLGLIGAKR